MTIVCLSFGLKGCVQEDPAKPLEIDLDRVATLTGKMLIQFGNSTQAPHIMSNTDFIVSVPNSSFKYNATGHYVLPKDKIIYVKENGEFTIFVPVGYGATSVIIDFSDFSEAINGTAEVIWKASNSIYRQTQQITSGQTINLGTIIITDYTAQ